MNLKRNKPAFTWYLLILFLLVSSVAVLTGYAYYVYQKKSLLAETQKELSSIENLKIRQITQWRLERIGNANFLREDKSILNMVLAYLADNQNLSAKKDLIKVFKSLTDNFDYKGVQLLNAEGNTVLTYPVNDSPHESFPWQLLKDVTERQRIILSDLHLNSQETNVHLDLLVPLTLNGTGGSEISGILDLKVDPSRVLFPLLKSWPTPSRSSETMLIRKDGDNILFLNALKHLKNSELFLKEPFKMKNLTSAMAIRGIDGTNEGVDYRNVPVVAAMNKVPGTAWYMVAKTDREEVLSVLNRRMRIVIIIMVLFLFGLAMLVGFLSRNQRARYYREKYEDELNRLALIKHFDYILKFANDVIFLLDKDFTIVEANDRALEVYMYSRDEIIGMKLEDIRAEESLDQLAGHIRKVDENESATFETLHKRKDKTVFPVEVSSRLVIIEGKKYYQTIGRDITERKRVENVLKESEERFRKIFEESPFSMLITAKNFEIVRANLSFCKLTGYDENELKLLTFKDFTHSEHVRNDELSLLRLVAGEISVYQTEKRYIRKDGSIVWGSTNVTLMRNNKEEVIFFLVMIEDISKRKTAEVELEKSFSLLKATLESTVDGILVVDNNGKIVQYNAKFAEMWNIPQAILDSGDDSAALDFVKEQMVHQEQFIENVSKLYSDNEAVTSDILEFRDGRCFERYSQPQKINGISVGRVWSFRDITLQKKAEVELIEAKEKAEESDRLKTAFLHNISHEIRTPMNAIVGFSTLLGEPDLKVTDQQQYIDIIGQSSMQLLSIINDIVDIANIESGQVVLNLKIIELNSVLKNLKEQFSYRVREQDLVINLHTGLPDKESVINTDSTKLIQILSNLINNALKFTSKGQIDFGYSLKRKYLEFYVMDTGIGISDENRIRVFDRFFQVKRTDSHKYGGTGLGLSICKAYVDLFGGVISVESKEGQGTTFVFTIPYSPV